VTTITNGAVLHAVRLEQIPEKWRSALRNRVSEERRHRIERYLHQEDADRSLLAELLIRFGARNLHGIQTDRITFAANAYGKPYIPGCPGICFNISHSGDWILCAWDSQPIGVDVEQIRSLDYDLANRFFSEPERVLLTKQSESEKLRMFYRLWTLKESFIKQVGRGLSIPLDSFSVQPAGHSARLTVLEPSTVPNESCYFRLYELSSDRSDYMAAVCAMHDQLPEGPHLLSVTDLISD
jgi:4'-phosphopantetheinyl transferase